MTANNSQDACYFYTVYTGPGACLHLMTIEYGGYAAPGTESIKRTWKTLLPSSRYFKATTAFRGRLKESYFDGERRLFPDPTHNAIKCLAESSRLICADIFALQG